MSNYEAGELAPGDSFIPVTAEAIVFFGTNWTGLDSIDTSIGTGIFYGFAGPDLDSPSSINQHAIGIVPDGDSFCSDEATILAPNPDGSGNSIYRGVVTGFSDAGVSINWTQTGPGRIFYLAIRDFDNFAVTERGPGGGIKALGWKPFSLLTDSVMDMDLPRDGVASENDYHTGTWGTGSYMRTNPLDWNSVYIVASSIPPGGGQGISDAVADTASSPRNGLGVHFFGPFLSSGDIKATPTNAPTYDEVDLQVDSDNYAHFLLWDGPSQSRSLVIPGTTVGDEATRDFPHLASIEAVLMYSVSDAPQGNAADEGGAAGFCVITEDFQACAIVSAHSTRGAYQSNTKGWASAVGGGGIHAGEVELEGSLVRLTTTDGSLAGGSLVGIAFEGILVPEIWRPRPR